MRKFLWGVFVGILLSVGGYFAWQKDLISKYLPYLQQIYKKENVETGELEETTKTPAKEEKNKEKKDATWNQFDGEIGI